MAAVTVNCCAGVIYHSLFSAVAMAHQSIQTNVNSCWNLRTTSCPLDKILGNLLRQLTGCTLGDKFMM